MTKLTRFEDNKFNVAKMIFSLCDKLGNTVGKGENAGYLHFLLFLQCYPKSSSLGLLKVSINYLHVPNKKIQDWTKLKAKAENKINLIQTFFFFFFGGGGKREKEKKTVWEKEKILVHLFSHVNFFDCKLMH